MKVCFLILHYNEVELTKRAVDSIVAMNGDRCIVIVDNCSPNGSGKELSECYEKPITDPAGQEIDIKVILNKSNDGFAKGNNVGYHYIKDNCDVDCVVALNNDITFPQRDFISLLENVYNNSNPQFYLAGPDVYTPHIRSHISPIADRLRDRKAVEKMIEVNNDRISQNCNNGFSTYFRYLQEKYQNSTILKLYNWFRRNDTYSAAVPYDSEAYDCVLNGACLIFSKEYIKEYDFLFEEKTFLYGEEDFLTYRLVTNNEHIRYCPELKTNHVGEGSAGYTRMSYREYLDKIAHTSKMVNESLEVYLNYMSDK